MESSSVLTASFCFFALAVPEDLAALLATESHAGKKKKKVAGAAAAKKGDEDVDMA
jgi:hypothetical protein